MAIESNGGVDDKNTEANKDLDNKNGENQDGNNGNNGSDKNSGKVEIDAEELESLRKSNREAQKFIKQSKESDSKKKEDDLIAKGEFDKVLGENKLRIEALQKENTDLKTSNDSTTEKLNRFVNGAIENFKTKHGEEKLNEIKGIIGDDPIKLSESLGKFEKMIGNLPSGKHPADKSGTPAGKSSDRLGELRKESQTRKLTRPEQMEMQKLSRESK